MRHALRFAWCLGIVALLGTACGSHQEPAARPAEPSAAAVPQLHDCIPVGRDARGELLLCQDRKPDNHGTFVLDDGSTRELLDIESPGSTPTAADGGRVGHWAWAALSPDGSTLLAQWSAECEVPIAFFVPAVGGDARVVSGENDWATSPTSIALGWTTDGRAIVLFSEKSPCGSAGEPGLYLVALDGAHTRIRGIDRFTERLQPSLRPRSVESLR